MNSITPGSDEIFIFNPDNRGFLTSDLQQYEGKSVLYRTLRWFMMTSLFIGIPATLIVSLLYSIILQISFFSFFPQAIVTFVILFSVIAVIRYRRNSRLNRDGRLLTGVVHKYISRVGYSLKGYRRAQLLHYKFQSPTGRLMSNVTFVSLTPKHLADGRPLPEPGTKIGILYVHDSLYIVL